jgi:hypothetical protein
MFLAKLARMGNPLWAVHYGASSVYADSSPVIAVDTTGDFFLSGVFSDTLDFGGTTQPLTAISVDVLAAKTTTNGKRVSSESASREARGIGDIARVRKEHCFAPDVDSAAAVATRGR